MFANVLLKDFPALEEVTIVYGGCSKSHGLVGLWNLWKRKGSLLRGDWRIYLLSFLMETKQAPVRLRLQGLL